ncbi:AAA family ATPase [Olivibacter domesticus]|uniref:Predicted ATPase n=1 Tax=Olivibacter domesticus TaxID=407022 RepID=A0A1H7M6D3_OLID1|nr:AAA family ATPase [Olivibacter domesticus]SEL06659.1 Predicted ATPase [Olivibacter domesticus]
MIKYNPFFFILTGGPGSGKTSLLEELKERGYTIVHETGRTVIQQQVAINGDALPWKDTRLFAQQMLASDISNYLLHDGATSIIIFDRGIPDVLGYASLSEIDQVVPYRKQASQFLYNKYVFILPPWETIYVNDNERKQDFTVATKTHKVMYETYKKLGYHLIDLPKVSVSKRADILIKIAESIIKTKGL